MSVIYLCLQVAPSEFAGAAAKTDGLGPMVEFTCSQCGKQHDGLWKVTRRMVDTFGHFPVYRLLGSEHVIDGTLPHVVAELPRGAATVPQETAERLWHGSGHYFGEGA